MRLSIILIMSAILWGCNNPTHNPKASTENQTETTAPPKKIQKKKKKPTRKIPVLSDKNVVGVLKNYAQENTEDYVLIKTSMGNIKIKLFDETPLHKANFLMLANQGFYDRTVFYRVEKGFIIQGGDSDGYERTTIKRKVGYYTIPQEFKPNVLYHQPGAVSMARDYDNNPDMRSSAFDFFIVQGTKYSKYDLNNIEKENKITFTPELREFYKTTGGAAHLDNMHTVFGQVVSGMDVVNKIAAVEVDKKSWPRTDIHMTIKVLPNE